MTVTEIFFWFLSALALFSALMMVVSKNPVHSVLWLIVVFFAISGHYILLNAQFFAIVNLIVYAGAIMVLFLFVIMLMNLIQPYRTSKKFINEISWCCCRLFVVNHNDFCRTVSGEISNSKAVIE